MPFIGMPPGPMAPWMRPPGPFPVGGGVGGGPTAAPAAVGGPPPTPTSTPTPTPTPATPGPVVARPKGHYPPGHPAASAVDLTEEDLESKKKKPRVESGEDGTEAPKDDHQSEKKDDDHDEGDKKDGQNDDGLYA